MNRYLLTLLGLLMLLGCGGGIDVKLTSILPSPVTPGSSVTAYGVFDKTSSITVDGVTVAASPILDGLLFTLPETQLAGDANVEIKSDGKTLTGSVQVQPLLERAKLEGNTLHVYGKGWSSLLSNDEVILFTNGLKATAKIGEGVLEVPTLDTSYGDITLQVSVRSQSSAPITVVREAATIQGKVVFPAPQPLSQQVLTSQPPSFSLQPLSQESQTTLIVRHDGVLETYLHHHPELNVDFLPVLKMTRLEFASSEAAQTAITELKTIQGVHSVDFDEVVHTDGFERVALSRSSLATLGVTEQWHLALEGIPAAWQRTKGQGVVVAVIDTGVDLTHPDLQANLLPGYDFVDGDASPMDEAGHGTHVAGLVAANGSLSGVAPEASILPVRVLAGTSGGSAFTVSQGILWAAGLSDSPYPNPTPAKVLNLSLGSADNSDSIALAVRAALEAGVVVIAATGNAGGPLAYPAALDGVVAVTSLAGPKIPYQPWYANRGTGTWLTAYGGDTTQDQDRNGTKDGILSTDLTSTGGYSLRMGTSMASPQVAGLAALALASGTPAKLLRDTLASTTTELGRMGYDTNFGFGLMSGRLATTSGPKVYVVAKDSSNKIIAWSLLQTDNSYEVLNLPPAKSITITAMSDDDGDGILAEAGELISNEVKQTFQGGSVITLQDLTLAPSSGVGATLEAK